MWLVTIRGGLPACRMQMVTKLHYIWICIILKLIIMRVQC